ncbi:MAG: PD-(D/E)XK nuclease family protein, partial [Candidatus Methanofastidiosa archaeon]|nr:PD-(D/E)XK nuclease family protein [Candidatus Methanofastidiosa archaeon]
TIVDYKSSLTPLTPSGAMKRMQPALSGDEVDYQPLVYLAKLRKETPGTTLTFLYVYPLGAKHEMMRGKGSVEDLLLKVVYRPYSFASFLETPSSLECFATSKDRTAFLNDKGCERIARWVSEHPFPDPLRGAGTRELTAYTEALSAAFGSEKGAQSLVSDIAAFRKGKAGYNKATRAVYLFEDDLDAFLSFVDTQLSRMRECLRTGFSREPLSTSLCGSCEYRDLCCGGWD